ncbi:MATH domain and coiled-coil domain-containing protein At3g58370-like [Tasmannia lanceolata]|uniref:MATH domain and coiled-coil domain-containing protein At3g58370-like n=1 Tax=Tasmannia lanceolata TaxID=3420 RepID=UPI00406320F1
MGTKLQFSSFHHPQTDCQMEVINQTHGNLIRSYVGGNKKQWDLVLVEAEFTYNLSTSYTIGASPFEVLILSSVKVMEVLSGKVRWTIKNFSTLKNDDHYSDSFLLGDCLLNQLCILWDRHLQISNGKYQEDSLSVYLAVADLISLPNGWRREVKYSLAVIDQLNNMSAVKNADHKFTAKESGWGYHSFLPLTEFYDPARGYVVNDSCIVEAEFTVPAAVTKNQVASLMSIRTDVKEYPNSYALLVEMPGLNSTDINIQLVDNHKELLITADQKKEKEEGVKYVKAERFSKFSRKFEISEDMNTDVISAIYKDGLLTVTIDKLETKKATKTIDVTLA